jgi:hypothetical protein
VALLSAHPYRVITFVDDDADPPTTVKPYVSDEPIRCFRLDGTPVEPIRTRRPHRSRVLRPRARVRQSHRARPGHRRAGATSSTSSQDPSSDSDSEPPRRRGELRHVSEPLADELTRIAARLRARGGVG